MQYGSTIFFPAPSLIFVPTVAYKHAHWGVTIINAVFARYELQPTDQNDFIGANALSEASGGSRDTACQPQYVVTILGSASAQVYLCPTPHSGLDCQRPCSAEIALFFATDSKNTKMKNLNSAALPVLIVLIGLTGSQARADNMVSIAVTPATGVVTPAPRWSIGGNLAGFHLMSQDWG